MQVTYHSFGPGATFEYLHKVSPAIPTLRALQRHMEHEFETLTHGAHHGIPDKEADIAKLMEQYVKSQVHVYTAGRQLKGNAKYHAQDYINKGAIDLERLGTFDNWWSSHAFARSRKEEWGDGTDPPWAPEKTM